MRQRLALATALLGDPRILILDEPANGLDPEGIVWLRGFLRHLATTEGRTVLVSSHVLSEVEQTVDSVVIVARGRLVHEGTLDELRAKGSSAVVVDTPAPEPLVRTLTALGMTVTATGGRLQVEGATRRAGRARRLGGRRRAPRPARGEVEPGVGVPGVDRSRLRTTASPTGWTG